MKDPLLADQRATSFLSNTVGSSMKINVEDVNSDKMIDRPVYSDRLRVTCDRLSSLLKTQVCVTG